MTNQVLDSSLRACSAGPTGEGRRGPTGFQIEVLLRRLPLISEYRYKTVKRGIATFYAGVIDGVAHFFMHNPRDESGFGGRIYSGVTEDGEPFSCRGPWSSGASEINALGILPPMVEASGTDDPAVFERGYTMYALSGVTVDLIHQAEALLPGWRYEHTDHARSPCSIGASDQQARVIEHPGGPPSGWIYERPFDPCPVCGGRTFVDAVPGEKGAWQKGFSFHKDRDPGWTKPCPECGTGVMAGIVPVPGMRWRRGVVRGKVAS